MIEEIDNYLEIPIEGGGSVQNNEVLGGYAANYSVGNNAIFKVRDNILDWKLLPKKSTQQRKIQTVNDILNLGRFIDNPKALCAIIKEIYELPDKDLIKALSKNLNLTEPLEISLRKLYYVWADLIETIFAILLEQENVEVSPMISLLSDLKNTLEDLPTDFPLLKKLKLYEHKGYCPCEPVKRISNLFTFPLGDMIHFIKSKNPTFMIGIDLNEIYERFVDIINQIDIENKKLIPAVKSRKPLPNAKSGEMLDKYVEYFIDLYRVSLPALKEQEKKYIELAKNIVKICNSLETVITNIL